MSNIINENLIKMELHGDSKEAIIRELAQSIDSEGRLNNFDDYVQEVIDREGLSTTGIGFGVAIPHGKTEAVKTPTVAFGRSKNGLEWESLDGQPVHMIFLLAVPKEAESNTHLKILAALSRKLMNEDFRELLVSAEKKENLMNILEDIFKKALQ
ncbi:PTS sugar transporter subunit IIA [Sporosalibacterium faouarense]|uniref:PTS sugar transporter subunit IIA n=1 Tax=Sporosalibacterium faouarense TaxID=516123 RepID=UPI00141C3818|nr:fructose PTS transporter subunit IIA [Sporosalibacterium faouarense]MTI47545.1 PTS fructose transporter subunit IIA [Bacillota bacterium]